MLEKTPVFVACDAAIPQKRRMRQLMRVKTGKDSREK